MIISLGILDFFILFLALHGLVLSILLTLSARKIKNNYWVAALIFVLAETTLIDLMIQSGYWYSHTNLIPFIPELRLATGPLLYFYVRGLTLGDTRPRGKDYWHFTPLLLDVQYQVVALLYVTGILAIPAVQHLYFLRSVQSTLFFRGVIGENLPTLLSISIYSVLCYRMISGALLSRVESSDKLADLKRARNIIYAVAGLAVILVIMVTITFYTSIWPNALLYIPLTLFIYWMGMSIYRRHSKMTTEDILAYQKSPGKTYFTNEDASYYRQRLVDLMHVEKVYLDPSLKMDILASKLSLTERSISNLLNQHIGKSFNDFINSYRVEEAKIRLADPLCRQFTIAAIGLDCGFNSLATFQRCFKQFTGFTPGQYQKLSSAEIMLKS